MPTDKRALSVYRRTTAIPVTVIVVGDCSGLVVPQSRKDVIGGWGKLYVLGPFWTVADTVR